MSTGTADLTNAAKRRYFTHPTNFDLSAGNADQHCFVLPYDIDLRTVKFTATEAVASAATLQIGTRADAGAFFSGSLDTTLLSAIGDVKTFTTFVDARVSANTELVIDIAASGGAGAGYVDISFDPAD